MFPPQMPTTEVEGKVTFTRTEEGNLIKVTANGATVVIKINGAVVTESTLVKKDTELVITVTPPSNHEIESVTFNGKKLNEEADKSYKTKMSEGEAALVVNIKGGVTPPSNTYKAVIAPTEHGSVSIHVPKINGEQKLEDYEETAITNLEHGKQYILVMKPDEDYVLGRIDAKMKVQNSEVPINSWRQKFNAMKNSADKIEYYYVSFNYPAQMGTEGISIAVTFDKGNLVRVTDNGATVKVMQGVLEVTPKNKVGKGMLLTIAVTAPDGKEIEKVEFAGTALTLDEKTKVYTATMPNTEASLVVSIKGGTPVTDAIFDAVVVYPNPFTNEIVLTNLAEVSKISLISAQGIKVRTVMLNDVKELRLAVEDLPAGLYLVLLENGECQRTIRLVK